MRKIWRNIVIALGAVVLALGFTSCGDGGKYVVADDCVYYTYWTFSFGQLNDTLPGADPASFESVKNWLGHDNKQVFFKNRPIPGADPATIKAKKYPLSFDKRDWYFENAPLRVADMSSFEILLFDRDLQRLWAKDSRYVYYDSTRVEVEDIKAFKVIDYCTATDGHHVYLWGKRLADADPATFEALDGGYFKDKNHVWYIQDLVEGADDASF